MESAQGWVAIVCTTLSLPVFTTDTVSLLVLATKSAESFTCSAVGCRPTSMDPTGAAGLVVSMTLRVPVVEVPR